MNVLHIICHYLSRTNWNDLQPHDPPNYNSTILQYQEHNVNSCVSYGTAPSGTDIRK